MKKAISPMVATVLLIGFTIAVGAILSVWFITFTRTQTAGVEAGAACTVNRIDVKGISLSDGILTYMVVNSGEHPVNVTSVTFTCDTSWTNSSQLGPISPGSSLILTENTTQGRGSACSDTSKVAISVLAKCTDIGGTTQTACPKGTCFSLP